MHPSSRRLKLISSLAWAALILGTFGVVPANSAPAPFPGHSTPPPPPTVQRSDSPPLTSAVQVQITQADSPDQDGTTLADTFHYYAPEIIGLLVILVILGVGMFYVSRLARHSHESRTQLVAQLGKWKQAEEALQESEKRFRHLFEKAAVGIVRTDLQGRILEANPAFCQLLGYPHDELRKTTLAELTRSQDWDFQKALPQGPEPGERGAYRAEKRFARRDGNVLWINLTVTVVHDIHGQPEFAIAMVEDVTTRKQMEERLRFDALHDALTQLPNRNLFLDRMTHAISRTRRNNDNSFAVLYLDVDDFKKINDSLGHLVGDRLLLELTGRIQNCIRPEDTVARLGGDEFALLLESVSDPSAAEVVARRILDSFSRPFLLQEREILVSASIGLVHTSMGIRDAQEFLRDADTAMYHAKRMGKNQYALFEPSMHEAVLHILTLEEDIRRGLRNGEFAVYYQPIVDIESGHARGFEALVRWNHPDRGTVPPEVFIPVARDSGLIVPLGEWVLEEACRQTSAWHDKFTQPVFINVNLDGVQFAQPDLPDKIAGVLQSTGLTPGLLTLEMTESLLLEHAPITVSSLSRLKSLGVKLCIDHFGTGFSSLAYFNRFPLDSLKIDRSFVMHMIEVEENQDIVRAVGALAKTFGLDVVAEGVETDQQLDQLCAMGYQFAQGFLFHPAIDAGAVENLLEEQFSRLALRSQFV